MGSTPPPPDLLDEDGNRYHSEEEKEEALRGRWARVYTDVYTENLGNLHTDADITRQLEEAQHRLTPAENVDLSSFSVGITGPVTLAELNNALKHTKDRAPGATGIRRSHLVRAPENIRVAYALIFSACLASGYFPRAFKGATLVFIPKSASHQVADQRPISLLEVPGKLLEKIVPHRLRVHLNIQHTLSPRQYGFRPGRGTTTTISLLWEQLAHRRANNNNNVVALRDVSKAFDRVHHNTLRYKLLMLDLPAPMESFLSEFLRERTARVRVGGYRGPELDRKSVV